MILSDRSIREALASGRIAITPLDEANIQPSSVDLRLGRFFRVFLNHTTRVIDVKEDQEDLTPLVEIQDDDVFILHPGEFVLGSTAERVSLPDDLVARLEGKSSLGRLGLLIHSSLPASERVLFLDGDGLRPRRIGDVVDKRLAGSVVGFDPETLSVGYHEVTGWFEGPADRIFEVLLASGRSVRVTAGHNLFTLDRDGEIRRVRTGELRPGTMVAVARAIPEPPAPSTRLNVLDFAPESSYAELTVAGPAVTAAFATRAIEVHGALRDRGLHHVAYYRSRSRLPVTVARQIPQLLQTLGPSDVLSCRGRRYGMPAVVDIDEELAWLLGLYVAEGSRRRNQVVVSNTDQSILDRAQRVFARLGIPVYRSGGAVTAMSRVLSHFVDWIDAGPSARKKQVPPLVFGWPAVLLESFIEGFVDGDGSREATRTSLWSSSPQLVDDLLYLSTRLGRRASASLRLRHGRPLYQVSVPKREHKLLTTVPLPDRLLLDLRREAGLNQLEASRALGYRHASDLNNIERRCGRDAVRQSTLRRFQRLHASLRPSVQVDTSRLDRLVDGGVLWDRVVAVEDTGAVEPVYDLEVRPSGRRIENFLAGVGGVFVSNTAGFVDCGFQGHLTLELSNVANLPITLYPGMKIGQISFLRMTTPADRPYGSKEAGSKYQGQQGPTPSRYFENFQ